MPNVNSFLQSSRKELEISLMKQTGRNSSVFSQHKMKQLETDINESMDTSMMMSPSPNDTSSSFLLQTQLDALRSFNNSKRQAMAVVIKDECLKKPELVHPNPNSTVKVLNNYRRMLSHLRDQTH